MASVTERIEGIYTAEVLLGKKGEAFRRDFENLEDAFRFAEHHILSKEYQKELNYFKE